MNLLYHSYLNDVWKKATLRSDHLHQRLVQLSSANRQVLRRTMDLMILNADTANFKYSGRKIPRLTVKYRINIWTYPGWLLDFQESRADYKWFDWRISASGWRIWRLYSHIRFVLKTLELKTWILLLLWQNSVNDIPTFVRKFHQWGFGSVQSDDLWLKANSVPEVV